MFIINTVLLGPRCNFALFWRTGTTVRTDWFFPKGLLQQLARSNLLTSRKSSTSCDGPILALLNVVLISFHEMGLLICFD
ncbi:hypothetical protein K1719_026517 [Acacia pycnantha]|nr:hypothetical protein K1719_026517 [Acacia pycnantha]